MPQYAEFLATISNAIISKTEDFFLIFSLKSWNVHEIYNILKKKYESPSVIISEIIVSERVCYWNV